jgi:glycosidase
MSSGIKSNQIRSHHSRWRLYFALSFSLSFVCFSNTSIAEINKEQSQVTTAHTNIDKVEPPSWWIGMKQTHLQIMLHGKNIGKSSIKTSYPGVRVVKRHALENPNYLFVDLNIAPSTKEGKVLFTLSQAGKEHSQFHYTLSARKKDSSNRASFTPKDAIYLLMPDRFSNGNINNDNHADFLETANRNDPGGRHGGDIDGIRKHLSYIAQLGFTMLWPTPLIENNQAINSYHGYSATDFYRIDPRFGQNEDYRQMVKEAKQLGVGVIQDIVLNHIGSNHWWLKDLPISNWLNYPNQYVETNHIRSTALDPNVAMGDKDLFSKGWFTKTMPDLNQNNPYLANYLIQNTLWWIEYADLSGLRIDTYSYSDKHFLAKWSKRITEEYPHLNLVGEEWSMNPAIVAYWQKNKLNQDGYRSYLPSMMDFPVYENLYKSLLDTATEKANLTHLYDAISNDFQYADPSNLTIFEGNHDTPRIYSQLGEDIALAKMEMIMLATLRGIPQMFYGTELLMTSPQQRDDGKVRGDFPGGWDGDLINAFTAENVSKEVFEHQQFIRQLYNWRKTSIAIHQGKMVHYSPQNNCYVYFRIHQDQKIMVLVNRNEQEQPINLSRFKEVLDLQTIGIDVLTNQKIILTQDLKIKAKTALILDVSNTINLH